MRKLPEPLMPSIYTPFIQESDVANSANYADTEKQIVLSYMATMRWGMWYWNALLENESR